MLSSLLLVVGIGLLSGGSYLAYKGFVHTPVKEKVVNSPWIQVYTIKDLEDALIFCSNDLELLSQFDFNNSEHGWYNVYARAPNEGERNTGIHFFIGRNALTVGDLSEILPLILNKELLVTIGDSVAGVDKKTHCATGIKLRINRTSQNKPFVELDPNSNYAFVSKFKQTK